MRLKWDLKLKCKTDSLFLKTQWSFKLKGHNFECEGEDKKQMSRVDIFEEINMCICKESRRISLSSKWVAVIMI